MFWKCQTRPVQRLQCTQSRMGTLFCFEVYCLFPFFHPKYKKWIWFLKDVFISWANVLITRLKKPFLIFQCQENESTIRHLTAGDSSGLGALRSLPVLNHIWAILNYTGEMVAIFLSPFFLTFLFICVFKTTIRININKFWITCIIDEGNANQLWLEARKNFTVKSPGFPDMSQNWSKRYFLASFSRKIYSLQGEYGLGLQRNIYCVFKYACMYVYSNSSRGTSLHLSLTLLWKMSVMKLSVSWSYYYILYVWHCT